MKNIIDKKTGMYLRQSINYNDEIEEAIEITDVQGFWKPRWNGESWEEGATQEYIDSLKTQAPEPPTDADRIAALESAMLDMILGGV